MAQLQGHKLAAHIGYIVAWLPQRQIRMAQSNHALMRIPHDALELHTFIRELSIKPHILAARLDASLVSSTFVNAFEFEQCVNMYDLLGLCKSLF